MIQQHENHQDWRHKVFKHQAMKDTFVRTNINPIVHICTAYVTSFVLNTTHKFTFSEQPSSSKLKYIHFIIIEDFEIQQIYIPVQLYSQSYDIISVVA